MTWYKEEFPGVMAFTGNVMKDMGYTGQYYCGLSFLVDKRKPLNLINKLKVGKISSVSSKLLFPQKILV